MRSIASPLVGRAIAVALSVTLAGWAGGSIAAPNSTLEAFSLTYDYTQDEGAKLTYGVPGSDHLSLMMVCAKGAGHVELDDFDHDGSGVHLSSNGKTSNLTGKIKHGDNDSDWVQVNLPASSPSLRAFRDTGRIEIKSGARTIAITARGTGTEAVESFFATCGGDS